MTIFLAADHAGFTMKESVKNFLREKGYKIEDVGAYTLNPTDDYPVYMHPLAKQVLHFSDSMGILFGGSGQGEAMVANRYRGIRAIVYTRYDLDIIRLGREHNNANVLSIGARFLSEKEACASVDLFLTTPFPGESRHTRRIAAIDNQV